MTPDRHPLAARLDDGIAELRSLIGDALPKPARKTPAPQRARRPARRRAMEEAAA